MRKIKLLPISIALALTTQIAGAADYLLDATTMAVGATAGENLVVKEGCLDPTKTSCTDKYKWLTATSAIKIGNLQVLGELKGEFEVVITLDSESDPKGIKLLTSDNQGISLTSRGEGSWSLQTIGSSYEANASGGWKNNYAFNELKLTIQQGETESVAKAFINGVPFRDSGSYGTISYYTTTFPKDRIFNRIAFEGITTNDRISDIKVRGISNTTACSSGSSTTTTPISGTTNTSDLPQIASNLDIKIPRGLYSQSGGLFTPTGSIPVWADLKYNAQSNYWTLTGAGVLPQ